MAQDFDFTDEVRGLQVPTLVVAADADMAPPSHYVEVFELLDGGLRDGGWMGEGRPAGGHALAILPGLTHYNLFASPLFAQADARVPGPGVGGRRRQARLPKSAWISVPVGQTSISGSYVVGRPTGWVPVWSTR